MIKCINQQERNVAIGEYKIEALTIPIIPIMIILPYLLTKSPNFIISSSSLFFISFSGIEKKTKRQKDH